MESSQGGNALVICGDLVHSIGPSTLELKRRHCIGVKEKQIVFVCEESLLENNLQKHNITKETTQYLKNGQFLIPGLIDTHIHASQYKNAGNGLDLELLDWLNKYTFPTESKYADSKFATDAYKKVVDRTLRNGTTTACYFATIHVEASGILCDIIETVGQRALIGKVNMNVNSPDYYCEKTKQSVEDTERFINDVLNRKNPLVQPVITPRFAVTCDNKLMSQLGDLAKKYNVHIQTHISENRNEVKLIEELYPDRKNYTDVYAQTGLLGPKTVLAHGVYLSKSELDVIKATGSGISHCPNSNLSLKSGLLDVREVLKMGVKVGLGTDVSGGYDSSILDAIRRAVHTSNTLYIQQNGNYSAITHKEAFYLATLGASQVLAMEDKIGNFIVGKEFDALLIDAHAPSSPLDVFSTETLEDIFQKFIYLGDDRNIIKVYVAGKQVI